MLLFTGASSKNIASAEELQDVLELLSCGPNSTDIAQSCPSLLEKSLQSIPSQFRDYDRNDDIISSSSQGLTVGSERQLHRQDFGKRTWPRMNGNVNPAEWGWMFSQSDNNDVFQCDPKLRTDYADPSQIRHSLNEQCLTSMMLSNGMIHPRNRMQDPASKMPPFNPHAVTSPSHQKQPSDVSVTSDGHTKRLVILNPTIHNCCDLNYEISVFLKHYLTQQQT